MADQSPAATLLFLRDEELRSSLQLMLAAERRLTAASEALLADRGLASAHGRLVMLVAQTPQMTVGSALDLLRVSKQTGSRVVRELVQAGLLMQRTGAQDRRQRQLTLTEEGRRLDRLLWERQRPRLFGAFRACGLEAVEGFRKVLQSICDPPAERRVVERPSAQPF